MSKQEIVDACVRFMGWRKNTKYALGRALVECNSFGGQFADRELAWCWPRTFPYVDGHVVNVKDYDPTADTPAGREQVYEIRKRLESIGYTYSNWYFAHRVNYRHEVSIHAGNTEPKLRITESRIICQANASTMNSAFAKAVYKLQTEIESEAINE